jgi:hypothetical protein
VFQNKNFVFHSTLQLKEQVINTKLCQYGNTQSTLNLEMNISNELKYYIGISNKLGLFRVDNKALREAHRCAPTKEEELGWQPVTGFQDAVSTTGAECPSPANDNSTLFIS